MHTKSGKHKESAEVIPDQESKEDSHFEAGKYQAILNEIEDGITETDLKGTILFVNQAVCNLTGYSKKELVGNNFRMNVDEETAKFIVRSYNKVYTSGIPAKSIRYEIVRKDGKRRITEDTVSLVKNAEGKIIGFRNVNRDITERRRAEKELASYRIHLEAIFRSAKDAIIIIDPELNLIAANASAENICGVHVNEDIGKKFHEPLLHCNKNCYGVLQSALSGKSRIDEYRIECNRNDRFRQIALVSCSPLIDSDREFIGLVLIIRDVSKISRLERELHERHQFQQIIGKDSKMQEIYALLEDLSNLDTTVLITGESGTGKELVARALHYGGSRAFKPLVKVNCSAMAETLLESELFGHVKGAFTGAIKDRKGRFHTADGGTILLDEIGDISPQIQLKLLRVIEEKEFERVGESDPSEIDVRIIACTNKDLKERVRAGKFREDLYYRLKVVEVDLPPLRERSADIPLLADHFCVSFNKKLRKNIEGISRDVISLFMNYPWPGNIRELEHTIERAFIMCHGRTITLEHIANEIKDYAPVHTFTKTKNKFTDIEELKEALGKTDWNISKAARFLGLSRQTIYLKMKEYGLERPKEYM
ncbi:MAG: sigma 54-interacting transcriptional regulator [Syntrophales bacterium]|jgi:PAS domain S-box-containing protein|nr:sigma 54-interacting transcriptional regulator [Syntrophales bacterium]MDY0043080.1 sigma 54-interacting transcriptional regulator [Syntrophales bacterium]